MRGRLYCAVYLLQPVHCIQALTIGSNIWPHNNVGPPTSQHPAINQKYFMVS